ncbi:hypothetical protein BSQ85_15610, partial [Enterococcus faecium]
MPPAIFFYYSILFDSRFKTLQQNHFIIPKDVPNAKTNITVNGASKVYKYHVDANKGGFTDDYVGLVEGNKNIRYPS